MSKSDGGEREIDRADNQSESQAGRDTQAAKGTETMATTRQA